MLGTNGQGIGFEFSKNASSAGLTLQHVTDNGNTTTNPILRNSSTTGSNIDYFISTTGNDANDGLTALTPFLTINHFLNVVSAGIFDGMVTLNFAAGTYAQATKSIEIKDILGAAATTTGYPSSIIRFLGTGVATTEITFTGNGICVGLRGPAALIVEQLKITGDGTAGSRAFNCSDNSRLILRTVDISSVAFGAAIGGNTTLSIESGNYTWATTSTGISISNSARLTSSATNFTLTGVATHGFTLTSGAQLTISGPGATYTITGNNATGGAFQNTNGGFISLGNFCTFNISNFINGATAAAFRIINGVSSTIIGSSSTYNITNCSNPFYISEAGKVISIGTGATLPVYNYLGGTPAVLQLLDDAATYSEDSFTGAVLQKTQSVYWKSAHDNRYPRVASAFNAGALPALFVGFVTQNAVQALYIPIYVATQAETITELRYAARLANGVAANDLYTVYVNGVATAMILNINNAAAGSTTANPIALVAGDVVSIGVVSDPIATAAADLTVQILIEKL